MADPGYPCNRHLVRLLEAETVAVPVDASTRFQPTAEQVARHWSPGAVAALLASPANPTGTVVGTQELARIIAEGGARGGRGGGGGGGRGRGGGGAPRGTARA